MSLQDKYDDPVKQVLIYANTAMRWTVRLIDKYTKYLPAFLIPHEIKRLREYCRKYISESGALGCHE